MRLIEHLPLLERADGFIRRKGTGNPEEFAARLNLSRSGLYRRLDDLKSIGAPIKYCRFSKSFYYEDTFRLPFEVGSKTVS